MSEEKKSGIWTIIVAAILLVVLVIYLFSYQVPANSAGIVYTLGKIDQVDKTPGLKAKWLYPIQDVSFLDLRTRLFDTKGQEIQTKDKINLNITISTGWKVTDPEKFIKKLKTVADAEKQILALVESGRNGAIGSYYLHDLINSNSSHQQEQFNSCEMTIMDAVKRDLKNNDWGVDIDFLAIKQLNFPDNVTEKVFKRMQEERNRASQAFRTEGEKQAAVIKSNATTKANETINKALSDAEIVRGKAEAEVAEYYKVFKKNPELAKFLAELKGYRKVAESGKLTQVIDPATTVPFTVMQKDAVSDIK